MSSSWAWPLSRPPGVTRVSLDDTATVCRASARHVLDNRAALELGWPEGALFCEQPYSSKGRAPVSSQLLPSEQPVQLIDPGRPPRRGPEHEFPPTPSCCAAHGALVVGRRINDQAYALVRQGRLAVYPSSHGQEACQVAAALVLARPGLALPDLPRHCRRRSSAAASTRSRRSRCSRATGTAATTRTSTTVAPQATPLATQLLHAVGVAHAATPARRGHRRDGDVRRRRHQRGRLPRGAQLRRGVPRARRVLRAEQRVRDLRAARAPDASRRRWRTRASATACRASGSTATTSPRCSRCSARRSPAPAPAAGPQLVEAHTYRMQAHTNADDATRYRARRRGRGLGRPRSAASGCEAYLRRERPARPTSARPSSPRQAEAVAADAARRPHDSDVEPRPDDLFAHVYADAAPRSCEEQAALARRRAEPRGGRADEPSTEKLDDGAGAQPGAARRDGRRRPSVLVFGEDVGPLGGVFRVTDGLTAEFGEDRCFDTPLAEAGIVGMAVGHGDERHAARRRDAVRRLRLSRRSSRSSATSPRCATAPAARSRCRS